MKKILLATDFSEGSVAANHQAIKLAAMCGSDILYFHAYTPPFQDPNTPVTVMEDIYEAASEHIKASLKELVVSAKSQGIRSTYNLGFGDLSTGISELIEEENVDLVVVGKTEDPGLLERILGSTATHLIHKFSKPLLIIPAHHEGPVFDHLMYASKLEYDETEILRQVFGIKNLTSSKLTIAKVDVSHEPDIHRDQDFIDDIFEQFAKEEFSFVHEKHTSFVEGIQLLAEQSGATLIVVATHHRNLIEGIVDPSLSKKLVSGSHLPVLVYNF